ncbi:MAG: AMP-binding protein [Burkholderiaceae bacterium]|nr:AMP-binding protein [Burkholderiaceae bacterium]
MNVPSMVSLENLLVIGRSPDHAVAISESQNFDFASFIHCTSCWYVRFAKSDAQRIALYLEDSFEFAAALFGAWHAKKCVYLPTELLTATVERLSDEVDIFVGGFPERLSPMQKMVDMNIPTITWESLDPAAEALVVFTSGSSGHPVAIPKRLSQIFCEVASLSKLFDSELNDACVYSTVSHQHIYGLLFSILWPLASGRPFATRRLRFPEDIVAALNNQVSAVLVASPAHLKRLPSHLDWRNARKNLRKVFSSGGPLPNDALPICRELLGQAPTEIYGSSETGGVAWRQRAEGSSSAWVSLPQVEVKVSDDELSVRSPHLPKFDWTVTEDRVKPVDNGFEILGRRDRIIKIEEKRISIDAMEQALLRTKFVSEVRVIALSGHRLNLGVVAVPNEIGWELYDKSGKAALNAELRAALANVAEKTALPRRFRFLWSMPSNASGKSTEAALQKIFDPRRPNARLITRSQLNATFEISISENLPFFEGHFSEFAVLPGVTQIEWAILFGNEIFDIPPYFLGMSSVKFQRIITPNKVLTMELAFDANTGVLSFTYSANEQKFSSGRISFGAST